jgi:hypothetical protein
MDAGLAAFVRWRARGCCEYCGLPERASSAPFEIDHIVARQHGGQTVSANLALACFADNHRKGPNLAGIDPLTGEKCWLFNPRRHKWTRHFRWEGPVLVGRTSIGRATVAALGMNLLHRVLQRAALMKEGKFPTS